MAYGLLFTIFEMICPYKSLHISFQIFQASTFHMFQNVKLFTHILFLYIYDFVLFNKSEGFDLTILIMVVN